MFVLVSFGFYVIWQNVGNSSTNLLAPTTHVITTSTKKISNPVAIVPSTPLVDNSQPAPVTPPAPKPTPVTPTPKPTPVVVPPPAPKKTGIYNDGIYTGDSVDAYYGNVQVQVTISNSRITDIQFLDYPQDRSTSVRINQRALPILKQEAISAQSAKINGVSGASETSPAFMQSLASALAQAKA